MPLIDHGPEAPGRLRTGLHVWEGRCFSRFSKLPERIPLGALGADATRPERPTGRTHSAAKRLGEQTVSKLIADYTDSGLSYSAIAAKYGISKTSVVRLLHERDVEMRARNVSWPRPERRKR